MIVTMDLGDRSYDIVVERGCIGRAGELLHLDRKCIVVTDEGVPRKYAEMIASQCREAVIFTVPQGEDSKSLAMLERILLAMLEAGFTRSDCVTAVGGGVPGDLAGFAAAAYMRGIDFYNIPTTLLSQADSSIGGKTAVNLGGVKNIAGAFWQPRGVLIDPGTLATLPQRQLAAGVAEIIKAGLIADTELFSYIEGGLTGRGGNGIYGSAASWRSLGGLDPERLIEGALRVKKSVVESDEREAGLRRILNFGHTIGHGIESVTGLLHGESVAIGMIPMCSPEVRERLVPVLEKAGLPVSADCGADAVFEAITHDKKMKDGVLHTVYVPEVGTARIAEMTPEELKSDIYSICRR